jgi:WD40 repeat protein
VKVWRTSDYGLIHTLSPMERSFGAIAFTPDSTIIAAAATAPDFARRVSFWDVADGQLLHSFEAAPGQTTWPSRRTARNWPTVRRRHDRTVVSNPLAAHEDILGDTNCDGAVTFDDIDPFVLALSGESAYQAAHPDCNWLNADTNQDGTVGFADINPFVDLLN